ncbi:glycosyltransferase family 4 protein [Paenarthrobacter sp. YIM B13468]|uniref:glycosyltransferase family 4 protein n=1 Tax=Paenarthrobacter sp. YIM B13468 TaxID=3366295 RepID=UPI003672B807
MLESVWAVLPRSASVLHYSADTGPLIRTVGPSVVTVHGVASRWTAVARSPRQEAQWRYRVKKAIQCTNEVITVSESSADDIAEVFSVDRDLIKVIHHGIDSAAFSMPATLSEETGAKIPERFVLYLGNIEPRKNIIELVRAFETPEIRALGLQLVIAGRPAWNFDSAMQIIMSSPAVNYVGFVSDEDRIALMQKCALFVFPSLYEGFGFPVLEAMAAGAPVATSRRGSLAEVAGPAWELASLDAEGIASSLVQALSNDSWQADVRAQGRTWASKFTWSRSIDSHLQTYERLVQN